MISTLPNSREVHEARARLHISLLGTPQIVAPYAPVSLPRRQPLALLAVLALSETAVARDRLAFLFWAEVPQTVARQRLRRTLSQLRQALKVVEMEDVLQTTFEEIRLNQARCRVDIQDFTRLAGQSCRARGPVAIAPAEQALALYGGPLLEGFTLDRAPEFELWLLTERERLARLHRQTLAALLAAYIANAEPERAIATAERLLLADPLREETHRTLMRLYAATGQRSAALRQYEHCLVVLERELGVTPLPETRALYEMLLRGEQVSIGPALPLRPPPAPSAWRTHPSLALPCVGRSAELARLQAALTAGLTGQPAVACISGPAGIGKTRLIREAVERQPAAVWLGGGQAVGQVIPYAAVLGAIRTALRRGAEVLGCRGAEEKSPSLLPSSAPPPPCSPAPLLPLSLSPVWLAEVSRLLPELRLHRSDLRPPPDLPPDQAQARLFEALTRLFVALAHASGGAVLVLDDLDDADAASLAWLGNLVRHLQGVPLGIAVAYRQTGGNPALAAWLDHLTRLGVRHDLPLTPLPLDAVADLLRQAGMSSSLAPDLASRLWDETGGTPFFVLETLRVLLESGADFSSVPARPLPLPETVQDMIQARIRPLDPATRQLLDACAVAGRAFSFDLVRAVGGRDEIETADALDTLVARQFLVEEGESYHFAHAHIAEVAYAGIGAARRRLLHRRAAEALQARLPTTAALVAHHLEQAGRCTEAAPLWLAAGQQAWALFAADDALVALNRGLAVAREPALRFALLAHSEEVLHHLGRREEQAAGLAEMERLAPHLPADRQAEVAQRQGRRLLALNRWSEAETALRRAAALVTPTDDAPLRLLAKALTEQQRRDEAQAAAEEALRRAEARADVRAQVNCRLTLAEIAQAGEDLAAAEAHLRQAMTQVQARQRGLERERHGEGGKSPCLPVSSSPRLPLSSSPLLPPVEARLTYSLGRVAFWRGQFDVALAHSLEAVRLYQSQANREGEATAHVLAAMCLARLRRHAEALEAYAHARKSYHAIQHVQGLAAATVNSAVLALRLGDLEGGTTLSRQAHELFATIGDERGLCVAANNLGAALVWLGQGAEADPWLRQALEQATALDLTLQQAVALVNLGAALLQRDRVTEARKTLARGLALRRGLGLVEACADAAALAIACLRAGVPSASSEQAPTAGSGQAPTASPSVSPGPDQASGGISGQALAEADALSREAVADLEATAGGVEHPQRIYFARAQVLHALGHPAEAQAALAQAQMHLEQALAALATPAEQQHYLHVFAFNRDLVAIAEGGTWPDPPRLA